MIKSLQILSFLFIVLFLSSCGIYNKTTMFQSDGEIIADTMLHEMAAAERNYVINKNDKISVDIQTNFGESLIDPSGNLKDVQEQKNNEYLIYMDGTAKLPLLGRVKLEGLTIVEADSLLELRYSEYYNDIFIKTNLLNKRVFVFGTGGGGAGAINAFGSVQAEVINLNQENMNLLEVLALAKGVNRLAKVDRIKIIRGDLNDPNVNIIDLSTIEGMKKANLMIQPNDIIYVEQYNQVVNQTIRSLNPLLGFMSTVINFALFLIIIRDRGN